MISKISYNAYASNANNLKKTNEVSFTGCEDGAMTIAKKLTQEIATAINRTLEVAQAIQVGRGGVSGTDLLRLQISHIIETLNLNPNLRSGEIAQCLSEVNKVLGK